MKSRYDRVYDDIFAVLNRWELIILRIEVLLLWERVVPSFIFNLSMHLIFWAVALTTHSTLFVASCALSVLLTFDVFWKWIRRLLDDPLKSEGSFTRLVQSALESGSILSIEELSQWVAKFLYYAKSMVNGLSPCRRSKPLLFFLLTASTSLACIVLSRHISGLAISYGILNLCLVAPVLIYHKVFSRLWDTVKPVLQRIESEFDKYQLETASEREAGEAELYGPVVAAAAASQQNLAYDDDQALVPNRFATNSFNERASEDLDTSEAVFIKQFVPKLSNEEIDRLFDNALGGATSTGRAPSLFGSEPNRDPNRMVSIPDATPWIMSDEYATDDDEVEDILDEATDEQVTGSNAMHSQDRDCEGFVVVPKSE
ncbi:hypothetical protein D915_008791 [Fasciola hepatica]|uniref:RETREG1-3/ARL6IP-like N-terminal reticulon-homology domain-containing protein n=1 Tax=Fasciola hepatica TaxID=6192 RepID=A0A4E0QZE8_FASHE|nr:hypothetical protein D915_008791 [Fasciola hepatica]